MSVFPSFDFYVVLFLIIQPFILFQTIQKFLLLLIIQTLVALWTIQPFFPFDILSVKPFVSSTFWLYHFELLALTFIILNLLFLWLIRPFVPLWIIRLFFLIINPFFTLNQSTYCPSSHLSNFCWSLKFKSFVHSGLRLHLSLRLFVSMTICRIIPPLIIRTFLHVWSFDLLIHVELFNIWSFFHHPLFYPSLNYSYICLFNILSLFLSFDLLPFRPIPVLFLISMGLICDYGHYCLLNLLSSNVL